MPGVGSIAPAEVKRWIVFDVHENSLVVAVLPAPGRHAGGDPARQHRAGGSAFRRPAGGADGLRRL
jgi:hypothetical protein